MKDAPPTTADTTKSRWHLLAIIAGPLTALVLLLVPPPGGLSVPAWNVVAITLWIIIWWLTEAIPIPATALIPIPFFPALGVGSLKSIAASYAHPLLLMFLGGFMLAAAMQRSGLHRRIALNIINVVGTSPAMIIAGFMLATAFLSMWISNTATTIMMFAVALPVIQLHKETAIEGPLLRNFSVALMLGIAYSASIGGVGTPIGTPPNALLASILQDSYNIEVNFVTWMAIGVPVIVVMLPVTWVVLTRFLYPVDGTNASSGGTTITSALSELGAMRRNEKMVFGIFLLAAFGWVFGKAIAKSFGVPFSDTAVAIIAALLLFALPHRLNKPEFLLDWESTRDIPWGVLLMLGGGLAIAAAFNSSGLAQAIGGSVSGLSQYSLWILVLSATALIVFITEITSNTASTATFLPILGAIAVGMGYDPRSLMIPVTLGASMAFMMPVATAPNAIVFSHEDVHITDMVRTGIWLNIISIAVCFSAGYWIASSVFGLSLN